MPLPDIPVDLWLQDQQDLFRSSADRQLDALSFSRDTGEAITAIPPDVGGLGWEPIEEQQRQEAARVKAEADAAEARAAEAARQAAAQELQRQLEAQRQEALDYGQLNNQNGSRAAGQGAGPQVPSGGAGDLPGYGDDARAFAQGADALFEQHFGEPPSEADQFRAQANGLIEQQFGRDAIDSIVKEDPRIRNWGQEGVPNQPPANPIINADGDGGPSTYQSSVPSWPSLVQQNDPAKGIWGGADTGQSMADGSIPDGPVDYRRDWDSRRSDTIDYSGQRQIEDAGQALGTAAYDSAMEQATPSSYDRRLGQGPRALQPGPSAREEVRWRETPGLPEAMARSNAENPVQGQRSGYPGIVDDGRRIESEDQAFGRNQGMIQPLPNLTDEPFDAERTRYPEGPLPRQRSSPMDVQRLSGTTEAPAYDPSTEGATPSSYDRPQTGEEAIPPQVPTGAGSPYASDAMGEPDPNRFSDGVPTQTEELGRQIATGGPSGPREAARLAPTPEEQAQRDAASAANPIARVINTVGDTIGDWTGITEQVARRDRMSEIETQAVNDGYRWGALDPDWEKAHPDEYAEYNHLLAESGKFALVSSPAGDPSKLIGKAAGAAKRALGYGEKAAGEAVEEVATVFRPGERVVDPNGAALEVVSHEGDMVRVKNSSGKEYSVGTDALEAAPPAGTGGAGGGDLPPRGPTDLGLPEPPPRPEPPTGEQFTATPAGEAGLGRLDRMIERPRMEDPQPNVTGSVMTEIRRQLTDDRARAQDIQNAIQKLSDQPLPIEARMVEMSRLSGAGAGEQYLKEMLPPILQRLGSDAPEASKYLALRNNLDIAADIARQHGPEAAAARRFSGDLTAAESEGALGALAKRLGPERMGKIEREAQEIYKVNQVARQMLVDSELLTPAAVADWAERYPHWVKTQIVDYAGSGAPKTRNGATISLSDNGVRAYTVEGTIKDRADPLLSTAQNLLQASSMAAKNRTFVALAALREQSPEFQQLFRQVRGIEDGRIGRGTPGIARTNEKALAVKGADRFLSEDYALKADEVAITGFLKGVKTTFIGPKSMEAVVTMSGATPIPIWSMLFGLSKELATSRNPGFVLTMAPLRDLASYGVRATSREGGPTPRVLADIVASYVRGVGDAFQGVTEGRVTGPMSSRALREGGGMSGMYMEQKAPTIANTDLESVAGRGRRALAWVQGKNVDPGKALLEELSRPHVYTIKSAADIRRIAFQTLTGGPVKAFAERMELAPRTAQLGLTERRLTKAGASAAEATFQGVQDFRTVTIDFNVGGELSKKINMGLQFFNVGMQAMVTPWRAFRERPKAFTATVATLIGGPAIEAELWNRADPERAQDYDDVPAYVKDIGIVWMAPKSVGGIPIPAFRGTDIKGNPRPNYFFMPLGEFAPFAVLAREAAGRALGAEGRGPRDLAQGVATSLLPVQGAVPLPPVASTAVQLASDYDFFRGRKIATKQMDQDASVGSQAIANTINRTLGKDVRPSQVDFFLRDIGRAGANAVLGATDIAGGRTKAEDRIQNTPIVGGVLRRVLGDQIGGQLQHAQQDSLNNTTLKMLQDNGISWRPSLVDNNISGMPITLSEQAKIERETMTNFNREAVAVSRTPAWEKAPVAARQAELQRIYTVYHAEAERGVAGKLPRAEIERRLATAKGK